jgi:hypothetical protein
MFKSQGIHTVEISNKSLRKCVEVKIFENDITKSKLHSTRNCVQIKSEECLPSFRIFYFPVCSLKTVHTCKMVILPVGRTWLEVLRGTFRHTELEGRGGWRKVP